MMVYKCEQTNKQPPSTQLQFSLDLILIMGNLGINLTTNPGLDYI